jgi:hypothetical protein
MWYHQSYKARVVEKGRRKLCIIFWTIDHPNDPSPRHLWPLSGPLGSPFLGKGPGWSFPHFESPDSPSHISGKGAQFLRTPLKFWVLKGKFMKMGQAAQ